MTDIIWINLLQFLVRVSHKNLTWFEVEKHNKYRCTKHIYKRYIFHDFMEVWSEVYLEKPMVTLLVQKVQAFYAYQRFITMFIRAHHWTLS